MANDRYVYSIPRATFDEDFGAPCYIGLGKGRRKDMHLWHARSGKDCKGRNHELLEYLRAATQIGETLTPVILASDLSPQSAMAMERALIQRYGLKRDGGLLFNRVIGGCGCADKSAETRQRMREAAIARELAKRNGTPPKATRASRLVVKRDLPPPPDWRARKAKQVSELNQRSERREKSRQTITAFNKSQKHRDEVAARNRTPEQRAAVSAAKRKSTCRIP